MTLNNASAQSSSAPASPTKAKIPTEASTQAEPGKVFQKSILVLGDSLSAEYGIRRGSGWVQLLQQELDQSKVAQAKLVRTIYQFQNASISGETTAGGRARISALLDKYKPAIVVLELGGNDALRGLELSATEKNLREITQLAQKSGAKVLMVGMQIPPNFGASYANKFAAIFAKIATTEKAMLLPFLLKGVAERAELFQADRIHPTEAAQPIMAANVSAALKPLLGQH